MDDVTLNALRWILLTTDDLWPVEFARLVESVGRDRAKLKEIRSFLEGRLSAADPSYHGRMTAMIARLGQRLDGLVVTDGVDLTELVAQHQELDGEIAELTARLQALRGTLSEVEEALLAHVPPSGLEVAGMRFEREPGGQRVAIVDATKVPPHLCRLVPDEAAITRVTKAFGEAPPGTAVVHGAPRLVVLHLADT